MAGFDRAFEMAVSSVRFEPGVTREVGFDLADWGATHVLVVTDPVIRPLPPVSAVIDSLDANRLPWTLYDRVRVEPTDESVLDAICVRARHRVRCNRGRRWRLDDTTSDINALVEGTLPQHRVTKLSPRPAAPDDLGRLFEEAMQAW